MFPSPVSGSTPNITQDALDSIADAGAAAPSSHAQRLEPVTVHNVPSRHLSGTMSQNGPSIPKRIGESSRYFADQMGLASALEMYAFKHNALEARLKAAQGLQSILDHAAPSALAGLTVLRGNLMLTDPGRPAVLLIEDFCRTTEQGTAFSRFGLPSPELDRLEGTPTFLDNLLGTDPIDDDGRFPGERALTELKSTLQRVQCEPILPETCFVTGPGFEFPDFSDTHTTGLQPSSDIYTDVLNALLWPGEGLDPFEYCLPPMIGSINTIGDDQARRVAMNDIMQTLLNLSEQGDSPIERCSAILISALSDPDYSGPGVDPSTNDAIQKVYALAQTK
jgi:hypothetical protein